MKREKGKRRREGGEWGGARRGERCSCSPSNLNTCNTNTSYFGVQVLESTKLAGIPPKKTVYFPYDVWRGCGRELMLRVRLKAAGRVGGGWGIDVGEGKGEETWTGNKVWKMLGSLREEEKNTDFRVMKDKAKHIMIESLRRLNIFLNGNIDFHNNSVLS